jgi:hypothetical protein
MKACGLSHPHWNDESGVLEIWAWDIAFWLFSYMVLHRSWTPWRGYEVLSPRWIKWIIINIEVVSQINFPFLKRWWLKLALPKTEILENFLFISKPWLPTLVLSSQVSFLFHFLLQSIDITLILCRYCQVTIILLFAFSTYWSWKCWLFQIGNLSRGRVCYCELCHKSDKHK